MGSRVRVGVDVGGTFTDIVLMRDDGTTISKKILSTPSDFSIAIKTGLGAALAENDLQPDQVLMLVHGATVATNAIITRTGARTALITTRGFRDVLEIRRLRTDRLYDINWEKPPPLVPRSLRLEATERIDVSGHEIIALNEQEVFSAAGELLRQKVEAVAVSYLHSYANESHEKRTRDVLSEAAPHIDISLSCEVLPESKEYERTSTTVINAYVRPVVNRYLRGMESSLEALGVRAPIMIMQSNGGMMSAEAARSFPVHIIESGPAAGVTGAYHLASRMKLSNVLTLDMGGTTAKAAVIEESEISRSPEYEVGGALSIGHRLLKGGGYILRVPSIDIAEVGAGGGSIARVDKAGGLKVGPESAGADPGPACYNLGGQAPTVTDANVYLGFTNPDSLARGALKVHRELAEKAIRERISENLGLDLTQVAWGIRTLANGSLVRALRAVSIERGRDPRRFVLFAFGGMGPVHALQIAEELGIAKVVIPPLPGLFSAMGLLFAEVEHHRVKTQYTPLDEHLDYRRLNALAATLLHDAQADLQREGFSDRHQMISLAADVRYLGQDYALTIALRDTTINSDSIARLREDFEAEFEKTYGYRSEGEQIQLIALRSTARGLSSAPNVPDRLNVLTDGHGGSTSRRCYFGPETGWLEAPVLQRGNLNSKAVRGPAIIEEDNSLTVVLPGWEARQDDWSNIILERP